MENAYKHNRPYQHNMDYHNFRGFSKTFLSVSVATKQRCGAVKQRSTLGRKRQEKSFSKTSGIRVNMYKPNWQAKNEKLKVSIIAVFLSELWQKMFVCYTLTHTLLYSSCLAHKFSFENFFINIQLVVESLQLWEWDIIMTL